MSGGYDPQAYDETAYQVCAYDIFLDAICDFWFEEQNFKLCMTRVLRFALQVR